MTDARRFHRTALRLGALAAPALVLAFVSLRDPQAQAAPAPHPAADMADADARALLGRLAGVWTVSGRSLDADGKPDSQFTGTAAYQWSLGGMFLGGESLLSNGREVLQSVEFLGFNQAAQNFSRSALTDRDPANYCGIGIWDAGSSQLTFITDPVRGPGGTERRIRASLDLSNADRPTWDLAYIVGSGANERTVGTVQLALTRASESAPPVGSPGLPAGRGAPGMPGPGPMTPAQVQSQLEGVLRQKQQMQQQIEDMRKQMRSISDTMRGITQ